MKAVEDSQAPLDQIKRLAVMAMFSDDELFDRLVLKGGNAMDLIHRLSSRASIDLDFSMHHDFPDGVDAFCGRVERALMKTFRQNGYEVFDVKMEEKPDHVSPDMAHFWGGYAVEFKLIESYKHEQLKADVQALRRQAINIGRGRKFLIDISRFEYTLGKQQADVEGYRIYVYSPEMIVCEKLRAVCQQMPEYGPIIRRTRPGTARARDFFDIYVLVDTLQLDMTKALNFEILSEMFRVKNVPLQLLGKIGQYRDFHRVDFPAVVEAIKPGTKIESFDYYFDYVMGLVGRLEPSWNV